MEELEEEEVEGASNEVFQTAEDLSTAKLLLNLQRKRQVHQPKNKIADLYNYFNLRYYFLDLEFLILAFGKLFSG